MDTAQVRADLAGFLRKAPYARGAPNPTGSLTFVISDPMPGVEPTLLRFTIGVYAHGAFYTGAPISPRKALAQLRAVPSLQAILPVLSQVFIFLDQRRYVMCRAEPVQLRNLTGQLMVEDVAKYQWVWHPGAGYECIYLTATYPTQHGDLST